MENKKVYFVTQDCSVWLAQMSWAYAYAFFDSYQYEFDKIETELTMSVATLAISVILTTIYLI